jgi:hypothetical protein
MEIAVQEGRRGTNNWDSRKDEKLVHSRCAKGSPGRQEVPVEMKMVEERERLVEARG